MFVAVHGEELCEVHMFLSLDGSPFIGPGEPLQVNTQALWQLEDKPFFKLCNQFNKTVELIIYTEIKLNGGFQNNLLG